MAAPHSSYFTHGLPALQSSVILSAPGGTDTANSAKYSDYIISCVLLNQYLDTQS